MMKIIKAFFILVCFAAVSLSMEVSTYAQSGKLKCRIVNMKGKKLKGVGVTVEGESISRKLVTNKAGEFEIELPAGVYRLILEKPEFAKLTVTNLFVESGARCTYKFQMYDSQNVRPWTHVQRAPEQPIEPERQ